MQRGEAAHETLVGRSVRPHLFARPGPGPSVGHDARAGLLRRRVRRRRHGLVDERAAGRGLLPSRPLKTRVGVDAQGQTGGEPVGVLGLQAGYEWKPQPFGQTEWALKPAAELEGIYIGQQSPVGDMPINPGALGTQYVTLPMTVGVVLANAVLTVRGALVQQDLSLSRRGRGRGTPLHPGGQFHEPQRARHQSLRLVAGCVGDGLRHAVQGGPERGGGPEPVPVRRIQVPHPQSHAVRSAKRCRLTCRRMPGR